jgi:hypothetical protein
MSPYTPATEKVGRSYTLKKPLSKKKQSDDFDFEDAENDRYFGVESRAVTMKV